MDKTFYKVSKSLGVYVQRIIDRCWYYGHVGSNVDEEGNVLVLTDIPDEKFKLIVERAKSEKINECERFKKAFIVSDREFNNIFWLESMKELLKDKYVLILSKKEIDEVLEKLNKE